MTAGSKVTENVQLVRLLGEGGMGSVWVADHLSLSSQVAVKFISPDLLAQDESLAARFKREASVAAQLSSPHVVRIFDHGMMADGSPYIVMELLEGETLTQRLERTGPLPPTQAATVVTQLGKALRDAHRRGVVHRDIKADNLFLVGSGTDGPDDDDELFVKVLDFGIAKRLDVPSQSVLTATHSTVGTPEYMSPEQVLSPKDVDYRTDLWAFGVVAYRVLTGRPPFTGATLGALWQAVTTGKHEPASTVRPELPGEIDEWFRTAFHAEPDHRHPSAKAMADAFLRALAGEPAEIRSATEDAAAASGRSVSSPPAAPDARELLGKLPLPVAQLVRRAVNAQGARERHDYAYWAAEAMLKLTAAGWIGLWLDRTDEPDPELVELIETLAAPTLGRWCELLERLSSALAARSDVTGAALVGDPARPATGLTASLRVLAQRAVEAGAMPAVVAAREQERGMAGLCRVVARYGEWVMARADERDDAFHDELSRLLLQALGAAADADPLGGLHLALARGRMDTGTGERVLRWAELVGLASVTQNADARGAKEGQLCLRRGGGTRIPLQPLLVYHEEDDTGREQVGFLHVGPGPLDAGKTSPDRLDEASGEVGLRYLDYATGQSLGDVDASEAIAQMLSRLRDEPVSRADVEALGLTLATSEPEPDVLLIDEPGGTQPSVPAATAPGPTEDEAGSDAPATDAEEVVAHEQRAVGAAATPVPSSTFGGASASAHSGEVPVSRWPRSLVALVVVLLVVAAGVGGVLLAGSGPPSEPAALPGPAAANTTVATGEATVAPSSSVVAGVASGTAAPDPTDSASVAVPGTATAVATGGPTWQAPQPTASPTAAATTSEGPVLMNSRH